MQYVVNYYLPGLIPVTAVYVQTADHNQRHLRLCSYSQVSLAFLRTSFWFPERHHAISRKVAHVSSPDPALDLPTCCKEILLLNLETSNFVYIISGSE